MLPSFLVFGVLSYSLEQVLRDLFIIIHSNQYNLNKKSYKYYNKPRL